jgi:hypothetical protein
MAFVTAAVASSVQGTLFPHLQPHMATEFQLKDKAAMKPFKHEGRNNNLQQLSNITRSWC